MKELHFIEAWLQENFPNKTYFLKPVQKHFDEQYKNYQNNVIYFGLFSGNVEVISPFQTAPIQINETHTRPFIFSHLSENSSVAHTFTGWEISHLDLIYQHPIVVVPTELEPTYQTNEIFIRLGGCAESGLTFTAYHQNGIIYNDLECTQRFNGQNEVYSFSFDNQIFHSCNVNSQGQVLNSLLCEIPSGVNVPVSYWKAIHNIAHAGMDSVTYLDEFGEQQTEELQRSYDESENSCTAISGTVLYHIGCVPCVPISPENGIFTNQFTNQFK